MDGLLFRPMDQRPRTRSERCRRADGVRLCDARCQSPYRSHPKALGATRASQPPLDVIF